MSVYNLCKLSGTSSAQHSHAATGLATRDRPCNVGVKGKATGKRRASFHSSGEAPNCATFFFFFCQYVFTFYLFRWETPRVAFLTQNCLSGKVFQKREVHLVAASNSLKPDSQGQSPESSGTCQNSSRKNSPTPWLSG